MTEKKTRLSVSTLLSNIIGAGKEFITSELPTSRDILRYGIYLREQSDCDIRTYTVNQLSCDLSKAIIQQWKKASLEYPVVISEKAIIAKVKRLWELGIKVAQDRAKTVETSKFWSVCDKLFDILQCTCEIKACTSECKSKCTDIHLKCLCKKEQKIPPLELKFVAAQRTKSGSKGAVQIGGRDVIESKRQNAHLKRKQSDKKALARRIKALEDEQEYRDGAGGDLDENVQVSLIL